MPLSVKEKKKFIPEKKKNKKKKQTKNDHKYSSLTYFIEQKMCSYTN